MSVDIPIPTSGDITVSPDLIPVDIPGQLQAPSLDARVALIEDILGLTSDNN